jgi:hypothetical protein
MQVTLEIIVPILPNVFRWPYSHAVESNKDMVVTLEVLETFISRRLDQQN